MTKQLQIALFGCGNVGQGVFDSIQKKQLGINIVNVLVKDIHKKRTVPSNLLTTNAEQIFNNKDIEVIVELMGGIEPAYTYIKLALKNKKNVVTANKALLALHGEELQALAEQQGVQLKFEASVAASIPIIKVLQESFVANQIEEITGILNGTSNYILTKMHLGLSYNLALKQAQKLGFAEANPSLDVSGNDASQKLAILCHLVFGKSSGITEGIEKIDIPDIQYALEFGYIIKLLASAKREKDKLMVSTFPTLVPKEHILAKVDNEMNAIMVKGDLIGEQVFYGRGAGSLPTASAVISDILDLESHRIRLKPNSLKEKEVHSRWYVRTIVNDKPGVLAGIAKIFAEKGISILSVNQREDRFDGKVYLIFLLHEIDITTVEKALQEVENLDFVHEKPLLLKVEQKT